MARGVRPGSGPRNWEQLVAAGFLDQAARLFCVGCRLDYIERQLRSRYPALHHSTLQKAMRVGRQVAAAARQVEAGRRTVTPPPEEVGQAPAIPSYRYATVVGVQGGRGVFTVVSSSQPLSRTQLYTVARNQAQQQLDQSATSNQQRRGPGERISDEIWVLAAYSY